MAKPKKVIRCPECDSSFVYYRFKEKVYVCRKCGGKWDKEHKGGTYQNA